MDFGKADFVVVGATYSDGVMLLASRTLDYAELKTVAEGLDIVFHRLRVPPARDDIRIIAKINDYIEVRGNSYSEAWRTLFSQWAPTPEESRELSSIKELPR